MCRCSVLVSQSVFLYSLFLCIVGYMEAVVNHEWLWAQKQGSPWTGCQPIAGQTQRRSTIQTYGQLRVATWSYLHVSGRNPEYPEETQTDTERACKLYTEKHPWSTHGPCCYETSVLTKWKTSKFQHRLCHHTTHFYFLHHKNFYQTFWLTGKVQKKQTNLNTYFPLLCIRPIHSRRIHDIRYYTALACFFILIESISEFVWSHGTILSKVLIN